MITNQFPTLTEVRTMKSGQAVRIARMHHASIKQSHKDTCIRCRRALTSLPHPALQAYGFLADACGSVANALAAAIDVANLKPEVDGPLNDGVLVRLQEVAWLQGACQVEALRAADDLLVALQAFSEVQTKSVVFQSVYDRTLAVEKSACPSFQEVSRLCALQREVVAVQAWLQDWVIQV